MKKKILVCIFFIFSVLALYSKKDESDISVLILPFEKEYRKENRFLRKFFVEIRNKSFVSMIKYEKVFSACKKNNIDFSSINISNYSPVTDILKPNIFIIPSMELVTNVIFTTNIISVETNINSFENVDLFTNYTITNDTADNTNDNIITNTNNYNNKVYDKPVFSYTNIKDIRYGYSYTNIYTNENLVLTNIFTYINNAQIETVTNVNKIYNFNTIDVQTGSSLTNVSVTSITNILGAANDISSVIMSSMIYMKFNSFLKIGPTNKTIDFWIERENNGNIEKINTDSKIDIGDNIIFNFIAAKDSYVNIFYFDSESNIRLIFPNDFEEMSPKALSNITYTYPNDKYKFKIKIDKYGKNSIFIFTLDKKTKLFNGNYLSGTGFPYISKKTDFIINTESKIKKLKKKKGIYSIGKYDFECKEPFYLYK